MDIPTIIEVNGQPFEATNPITTDTVNGYVDSYNQALDQVNQLRQQADTAQATADGYKALLGKIGTDFPTLLTDPARAVLAQ